jgi:isoquinoline 1-oxidoreductase beta subunit
MKNDFLINKEDSSVEGRVFKVSRRDVLKAGALLAGGLVFGVSFVRCDDKKEEVTYLSPNVYLKIGSDGEVIIIAHRCEMGQGIRTSLPLIVADELGADWNRVKIVQAEGDVKYGDQNTDGSYSIRMFYKPMREAGAAARYLLIQVAAKNFHFP